MARTDTLGNFLTDVAEAIRTKEGTTETIPASEFDTRISNLSGGGTTGEDLTQEFAVQEAKIIAQEVAIANLALELQNKGVSEAGYVQNGLVALWDARHEIDANGHWKSQIGDDYWSVTYTDGGATSLAQLKTEDAIVTDGTVAIRNNVDYYKNGYTIELVGNTVADTTTTTNFFTFDKNLSVHINVNRYNTGRFCPQYGSSTDGYSGLSVDLKNLNDGKRHTMVIYLEELIGTRSAKSGNVRLQYSVDGSPWYGYFYPVSGSGSYVSDFSTILSYYSNSGSGRAPAGTGVSSIRVYNRKLTHKELMQNHMLDEAIYNVEY